jgi:hypothetical protein
MTVKELKQILANVPDETEVVSLVDGWDSHRCDIWDAIYSEEESELVIHC